MSQCKPDNMASASIYPNTAEYSDSTSRANTPLSCTMKPWESDLNNTRVKNPVFQVAFIACVKT